MEERMNFRTSLALVALVAAPAAFAQDDNPNGFYIGIGVGQFAIEIDDVDDATTTLESFDDEDTAMKAFTGYRFSPNFALEVDYLDLGETTGDIGGGNVTAKVDGIAPFAILTFPAGPVELSAKAGYMFYDVEIDFENTTFADESDEDLIYGAAVGLTVIEHLNLRLEYEIIDISDVDDANALWLSGSWRF
jgi:OOP family OmpA-OmpF porin